MSIIFKIDTLITDRGLRLKIIIYYFYLYILIYIYNGILNVVWKSILKIINNVSKNLQLFKINVPAIVHFHTKFIDFIQGVWENCAIYEE